MSTASPALPAVEPARPEKLSVIWHEDPDEVSITKTGGRGPGCFLALWLTGWTVGCVALAAGILSQPSIGLFLFAIPFWAAWLAAASFLTWLWFGKETLILQRDRALFLRTAFITLKQRDIPIDEIRGFRECRSSHTENDEHLWGIEMTTLGQPLQFAFRLPDNEREWLVFQLNRFLEQGAGRPVEVEAPPSPVEPFERATAPAGSSSLSDSPVLTLENTADDPPSDTRWARLDQLNTLLFHERGKLEWGPLLGLLFINAFWNGVVSVFVMVLWGGMPVDAAPEGWAWWGMFVFLIPFEVIGLAMLAGLVMALLEPVRRTEWRFEKSQIQTRTARLGLGRTRTWPVTQLDRLVRRPSEIKSARKGVRTIGRDGGDAAGTCDLVFVTSDNTELCSIKSLTEGEARWMAHAILTHRWSWFPE